MTDLWHYPGHFPFRFGLVCGAALTAVLALILLYHSARDWRELHSGNGRAGFLARADFWIMLALTLSTLAIFGVVLNNAIAAPTSRIVREGARFRREGMPDITPAMVRSAVLFFLGGVCTLAAMVGMTIRRHRFLSRFRRRDMTEAER